METHITLSRRLVNTCKVATLTKTINNKHIPTGAGGGGGGWSTGPVRFATWVTTGAGSIEGWGAARGAEGAAGAAGATGADHTMDSSYLT